MTDQSNDNQTQSTETTEQVANASVGALGNTSVGTTTNLTTQENIPNTESTDTGAAFDINSLSEDLRNEPSLANIKDINNLAKGYVHAQKELGSRVRIPGPDASAEVKAEFNKRIEQAGFIQKPDLSKPEEVKAFEEKLGITKPSSVDGFTLLPPQDSQVDETAVNLFKDQAVKVGLTQDQANKIFQAEVARQQGVFNTAKTQTIESLKKEWGTDFDARVDTAKTMLSHYEKRFPEAVKDIRSSMTGNNPLVLHVLAELGKTYTERGLIRSDTGSSQFGMTPNEAKSRIQEVMGNKDHPYHKGDQKAITEVETLYKSAYPEQSSN